MTAVTLLMLAVTVSASQMACPVCGENHNRIERTFSVQYGFTSNVMVGSSQVIGSVSNHGSTPMHWNATYHSESGWGIQAGFDSHWLNLGFSSFSTQAETLTYNFTTSPGQMGIAYGETLYQYQELLRYMRDIFYCKDHGYYYSSNQFDTSGHNKSQWLHIRYTEGSIMM